MRNLGLLVCVLAAGCARRDDGTFTDAEAKAIGDSIGTTVESSAGIYGPMDQTASADGPSCVTLTGDLTDTDLDSIPVSATLNYACSAEALGLVGMLTGTLALTDDNPNALAWAFTGSADLHASLAGVGGNNSIVIDRNGSIVASELVDAEGPAFLLTHVVDQQTVITTGGGDLGGPRSTTTTVVEDVDWVLTFRPSVAFEAGNLVVVGDLDATGQWNVTVDQGTTAQATLSTPTVLRLTPSCATLVTSGVVTATFPEEGGGTGSITTTWTACGQHTVENLTSR